MTIEMATKYLLDTNVCIELLKGNKTVRNRIEAVGPQNCRISEITVAELYYGASKSTRSFEKRQDIRFLLELFDLVLISPSLAEYGEIKAFLERKGNRFDEFDLLIGATAIEGGYTLVTNNTKHLSRIPGIKLEDWTE